MARGEGVCEEDGESLLKGMNNGGGGVGWGHDATRGRRLVGPDQD